MKGAFTQIKYSAQGVALRNADSMGMIVGVPIVRKDRIVLSVASANIAVGDDSPLKTVNITGDASEHGYRDGDILQSIEVYVRGSDEASEAATKLDSIATTLGAYGTSELIYAAALVCDKAQGASWVATMSYSSKVKLVTEPLSGVSVGDIAKISSGSGELESTGQYLIVDILTDGYTIEYIGGDELSLSDVTVLGIYYDYSYNYIADKPRGFIMEMSTTVYRAGMRGVNTINTMNDISDMFGESSLTDPLSDLAFGAFMFGSANGWKDKFKICPLNMSLAPSATPAEARSNAMLWAEACNKYVDTHKDAYYIVPLTTGKAAQDTVISYVNVSSALGKKSKKRVYLSRRIAGINNEITDAQMSDYYGCGKWGDEDYVSGRMYIDGYPGKLYLDVDADVGLAMSVPMSYDSERVTFIGCEHASIGSINIDGYHIAAIIAGWRSSLPMGYDASDMKVPLLTNIASGQAFYPEAQMEDLARTGWYMLSQDISSSPVLCYKQKTSAYDNLDKSEESLVVALDMCMKDIGKALAPHIRGGMDNRATNTDTDAPATARYIDKLNAALSAVRHKYTVVNEVFAALQVVAVRMSTIKRDAAEIDIKFSHYYPVREIYVTGHVG
jgi:hypothetical protein